MWTRSELKTSAKQILQKNYWGALLVALILAFVSGEITFGTTYNLNNIYSSTYDSDYNLNSENQVYSVSKNIYAYMYNIYNHFTSMDLLLIAGLVCIILIAVLVVKFVIFVPLQIGCIRWLLKNRTDNPSYSVIGSAFSEGYGNVIKVIFLMELKIFLWSLLFVIPGIIKTYEYRMIPYLLAENPNMSSKEAFRRTKELMSNNKMDTFVLDLSFIGWILLSACTFGILMIFFVRPYIYLVETELYVALCRGKNSNNRGENYNSSEFNSEYQEI